MTTNFARISHLLPMTPIGLPRDLGVATAHRSKPFLDDDSNEYDTSAPTFLKLSAFQGHEDDSDEEFTCLEETKYTSQHLLIPKFM